MDTIPFHCMMFAADLLLCAALFFWLRKRTGATPSQSDPTSVPYSQYGSQRGSPFGHVPVPQAPQPNFKSRFRDLLGICFLGGIGMFCIILFAVIFRTNLGQCIVEGLTYHGSLFLLVAAVLLCLRGRFFIAVWIVLLAVLIFGVGIKALMLEPLDLTVEHYHISSDKIKYPLRVVFVADIQTDRIGSHERRTLETIRDLKADLIILGGDYLQYYHGIPQTADLPKRFNALFKELPLTAPLGVYAINGNIDPSNDVEFAAMFEGTGIETVFFSEIIEDLGVDSNKGPIDLELLGMADSIDGVQELGLTKTGNFQIMVGHYPVYAIKDYQNSKESPDLMLAGHTHGGQIALPFYGPIRSKFTGREKLITREFLSGMKVFPNRSRLLVSRGSGMERGWAPRVRFLCKPEISVIDIEPMRFDAPVP